MGSDRKITWGEREKAEWNPAKKQKDLNSPSEEKVPLPKAHDRTPIKEKENKLLPRETLSAKKFKRFHGKDSSDRFIDCLMEERDAGNTSPELEESLNLWADALTLQDLYAEHLSGNKRALLEALFICFSENLPIPRWCSEAFQSAFLGTLYMDYPPSWDDIFGRPHKKGTHLSAKRERFKKEPIVYRRIQQILQNEPQTPIDRALFERVGSELCLCKTLTEEYYYSYKNRHKI